MQFEDAESYRRNPEANLSFKDIVLEHLKKITLLSCVEFRGGYRTEKIHPTSSGSYSETIYIPDSREVYINAVNMFHDLLLPIFDKKMRGESERLEQQHKEVDKKEWRKIKLKNKRELFQQLSLLLKRLRYLEGKSFGEET